MLHIHIITLGKLKETYWQEAEVEYLKRLKPFAKVTIHELKEESFSEKDKPEMIKEKEAEKIQSVLSKVPDAFIIALDENGKQFSSTEFSNHLSNRAIEQSNNFIFVIGGPLGLDKTITDTANEITSFSHMTFTHQMARVVLLEQLYRAMMIAHKRRYHY